MARIHIEVNEADLDRVRAAGVPYAVIEVDIELRELLLSSANVDELDDECQEQVYETAKRAISLGEEYGIAIRSLSGRDMNDQRCYVLDSVTVVLCDEADVTVKEMLTVGVL